MIYVFILIIIILIISAIICHFSIEITKYDITSRKVDSSISELKILQLSDLHNRTFGKKSNKLINIIDDINPDVIVITGDLLDKSAKGISNMLKLMRHLTVKYPCYYVIGNHELYIEQAKLKYALAELKKSNVIILNNECINFSQNIKIYGIGYNLKTISNDNFKYNYKEEIFKEDLQNKFGKLETNCFNILLAHNPFSFNAYTDMEFDLVFSGHVHGGIIRVPGIGGILSPQRKFFPKYSEGIYKKAKTQMIVSRGLGYGGIKFRIFNKPEIVVATLKNR